MTHHPNPAAAGAFRNKKVRNSLFVLLWASFAAHAQVTTNLAEAYAWLGFNPAATNCGTIVHISDIHMSESGSLLVWAMDDRLVDAINAIRPTPTVLAVTGDLGACGSPSPGFGPGWPCATNEIAQARLQLTRITNCNQMYVVPGNHDSMYGREDGFLFTNVFQGFSRYTNFTVAGLPVLMLDSQNGGWIDQEQLGWMADWRRRLDKSKPVMVMLHIPLFAAGQPGIGRESQERVLWFLEG